MTDTGSLFLTPEEVKELTGYARPSCQIRQLREQGIRFFVRADGLVDEEKALTNEVTKSVLERSLNTINSGRKL